MFKLIVRGALIGLAVWLIVEFIMLQVARLFNLDASTTFGKVLNYFLIGVIAALILPVLSRVAHGVGVDG